MIVELESQARREQELLDEGALTGWRNTREMSAAVILPGRNIATGDTEQSAALVCQPLRAVRARASWQSKIAPA